MNTDLAVMTTDDLRNEFAIVDNRYENGRRGLAKTYPADRLRADRARRIDLADELYRRQHAEAAA